MLSTYLQFAHLIIPNLYLWSPPFFVALLEFHDNPWLPSPPGLSSSALSSSRNHQEEFLPLHTLCCKDDKRKRVSFSIMLMKNDVTEWFPWWVDLFFPSWGKREKEKGENIILREDKAGWMWEDAICMIITAEPPLVEIWYTWSLFGPPYLLWYTIDQNILV